MIKFIHFSIVKLKVQVKNAYVHGINMPFPSYQVDKDVK